VVVTKSAIATSQPELLQTTVRYKQKNLDICTKEMNYSYSCLMQLQHYNFRVTRCTDS